MAKPRNPGGRKPGLGKVLGSGRKKGTPNHLTTSVKAMIEEALNRLGGADYLVKQGKKANSASFLTLVGKLVPLEHHAPGLEARLLPPDDATITRPAGRRIMFVIQQAAQRRLAEQRQQQPSKEKTQ